MRQGAYSDAAKYFSQCLALFNQSMPQEDAVYLTAMIERAEMEVQHGVQPTEAIPAVGRLQALLASMPEPPANGSPSNQQIALGVAQVRQSLSWAMAKDALAELRTRPNALSEVESTITANFEAAYELRLGAPKNSLAAESLTGLATFLHRVGSQQARSQPRELTLDSVQKPTRVAASPSACPRS